MSCHVTWALDDAYCQHASLASEEIRALGWRLHHPIAGSYDDNIDYTQSISLVKYLDLREFRLLLPDLHLAVPTGTSVRSCYCALAFQG